MNKTLLTLALFFSILTSAIEVQADQPPDFTALVERTSPSVVSVKVKSTVSVPTRRFLGLPPGFPDAFGEFFGPDGFPAHPQREDRVLQGEGSGFIIDSSGYIVTNAHVVEGADNVTVRLNDKQEYAAEVIGTDKLTDIALLKIDGNNFPAVALGDSDKVKVGDWVLAIGSPFGFDETATKGIVSALGRNLPQGAYTPFIQTDAAINPGNSGGPLFNSKGEVIGINSLIYTRSGAFNGLGFAIPINAVKTVVEQLKTSGTVTRGWLGVVIQSVDQKLAESFGMKKPVGALVASIAKDSPAQKAGLKEGDIILSYDGKNIETSADLTILVARTPIGKKVDLKILRNNKEETISVTIANFDSDDNVNASGVAVVEKIGIQLKALDNDARRSLDYDGNKGVLISMVKPNSPADNSGLREGDILLAVGADLVTSPNQARNLLVSAPSDRPLPILIYRDGQTAFVALAIK